MASPEFLQKDLTCDHFCDNLEQKSFETKTVLLKTIFAMFLRPFPQC